jgi:acetylornithine/N-succinyldiaminopimelate aminotransferase
MMKDDQPPTAISSETVRAPRAAPRDAPAAHALMEVAARPPQVFVRGQGAWLFDAAGKRYLDFVQGWAVNSLGHCPPEIAQALAVQARRLVSPSPAFHNDQAIAFADLLAQATGMASVFLASSGAEANEGAIKLARKWGAVKRGGAHKIITFADAFHGRTLATMSASGKAGWDQLFEPKVPGFPKATLNDLASVERLVDDATVAVMVEPVQGEAGVVAVTKEFLQALRALCDARGLLLILDDVQTGVGRTGTFCAFQHLGVAPDILTLGKGIGGGVPLAALLTTRKHMVFAHGDQGGTYCGNPLMAAVGHAVVSAVLAPGFLAAVNARAATLQQALGRFAQRLGGSERGMGLLRALVLPRPIGPQVVEAARALAPTGLLINAPRPNLLRLMPALNVSDAEIAQMAQLLDAAFAAVGEPA